MPGRNSKNVEFINKLRDLLPVTSTREFAGLCGKQEANISAYLNGSSTPGDRVLRSCLENIILSWRIEPEREIQPIEGAKPMPDSGGVYILYDSGGNVLYIGKAKDLSTEVKLSLRKPIPPGERVGLRFGPNLTRKKPTLRDLAHYVSLYLISDGGLRHNVEALLLRVFANQTYNSAIGHFRRRRA